MSLKRKGSQFFTKFAIKSCGLNANEFKIYERNGELAYTFFSTSDAKLLINNEGLSMILIHNHHYGRRLINFTKNPLLHHDIRTTWEAWMIRKSNFLKSFTLELTLVNGAGRTRVCEWRPCRYRAGSWELVSREMNVRIIKLRRWMNKHELCFYRTLDIKDILLVIISATYLIQTRSFGPLCF